MNNPEQVKFYVNMSLLVVSVAAFLYIVFVAKYDDK
jgi:hypothetical protein